MKAIERYTPRIENDQHVERISFADFCILFLGDEHISSGEEFMQRLRQQYQEKLAASDISQSKKLDWQSHLDYLNGCAFGEYVGIIKDWVSQILAYACLRSDFEQCDRERKFAELCPHFPDHEHYLRAKGITSANCSGAEMVIRRDTYSLGVFEREAAPSRIRRIGSYLANALIG